MTTTQNPAAPHTLPWFVTPPDATDWLYVITVVTVVVMVVLLGVFFFWLHSLPERMGHKKLQFEIVSVLALISLFTHEHLYWIIGLLLAMVDFPDVASPLRRIADAADRIAPKTETTPPPPGDLTERRADKAPRGKE